MGSTPVDIPALIEEVKKRFESEKDVDLNTCRFKAEPLDDALQRYLQARKFNVDDTVAQLKSAIQWRSTFAAECVKLGKEGCLGCRVDEVSQFYRGAYAGHCKDGRPIWFEMTGKIDIPALHCLTNNKHFIKYHVCLMEELQDKYEESTKIHNKTINKTMTILDMDGVTMSKLSSETIEFVKMISQVDSQNYPETMGKMLIINAPGIFSFAWGIIQGFLDPRTVSKIEVLGGPEAWKPRLQELVDQTEIPAELGGQGPPCLQTEPVFKEVDIASGGKVEETISVSSTDSLYYKFFTRSGGNISFKLVYIPEGTTQEVVLLPLDEFTADECSNGHCVTSTMPVPGAGQIKAVWEHPNWFSRTLLYRLKAIQQEQEQEQ